MQNALLHTSAYQKTLWVHPAVAACAGPMFSDRRPATPRRAGATCSSGYTGLRTAAELLQLPERQASGTRPIPVSTGTAVATLHPRGCNSYPTWGDASVQLSVRQAMQDLIQPQLDRLAEQISSTLGSAQAELHEMERLMERWEVRAEGRFASLESRLAVLSDGAARTEHRERDLNERIAGIAEDFLRRNSATGPLEPEATLMVPRLHDLEQRLHEATTRIDRTEETLRKSTKSVRRLEDCFSELEASQPFLWERKRGD
eukprot:TRINITY_DN12374_c0_g2_i2.p1 TRINITY_DN12374_c0_g2~~TRINITY_DN12374_c0_g2_i2.p1  ORF type:complete len:259 (-),score=43.53 TRINITY_DN12374_c0_g2_i2:763-1539(-)